MPQDLTPQKRPDDWYRPGRQMREFHHSRAKIRVLIGGRGSGKTTGGAVETIFNHCFRYAGARAYILRKTEKSNQDTTGETFGIVFGNSGTGFVDTGESLFKKIEGGRQYRLPSRKAVELWTAWLRANPHATKQEKVRWLDTEGEKYCSFLLFSGVPTSSARATRFRGFEASLIYLVEADQFDREDVDLAMACLRWKGADPEDCNDQGYLKDQRLILDTNPPSPRHWIAKWEGEALKDEDDPDYIRFWHLRTDENEHNLPPDYVKNLRRQYRNNRAMYLRMLEGQYAEAFDGSPVFWAFREDHAYDDLPFPQGAYLVCGWDFGVTAHATIFSAYFELAGHEYWWDLFEYYAEESDTETQCRETRRVLDRVFPWHDDRGFCSGVLHYCDVAGKHRKDSGKSSIRVLATHGFYPAYRKFGLQESITTYNRLLELKDSENRWCYRIDKKNCPMLYAASSGGYRYPAEGEPGFGSDEPGKGPQFGNYDHPADASRYAKCNLLKLAKKGRDNSPPVGKLRRKLSVNKPRRWR